MGAVAGNSIRGGELNLMRSSGESAVQAWEAFEPVNLANQDQELRPAAYLL